MKKDQRKRNNKKRVPVRNRISKQEENGAIGAGSSSSGNSAAVVLGSSSVKNADSSVKDIEPFIHENSSRSSVKLLMLPSDFISRCGGLSKIKKNTQSPAPQLFNNSSPGSPDRAIYETLKQIFGTENADYIAKGFEWKI